MGKSRIFIKSAIDQKNLKLGTVITWTINNLKLFVVIETYLEEFGVFWPLGSIDRTLTIRLVHEFGVVQPELEREQ